VVLKYVEMSDKLLHSENGAVSGQINGVGVQVAFRAS
jgi:hypothetical protein